MFKKYTPKTKELYHYRAYKIADLCAIHKSEKLHPQSIRKWIKRGELKAFLHEGDYYSATQFPDIISLISLRLFSSKIAV